LLVFCHAAVLASVWGQTLMLGSTEVKIEFGSN